MNASGIIPRLLLDIQVIQTFFRLSTKQIISFLLALPIILHIYFFPHTILRLPVFSCRLKANRSISVYIKDSIHVTISSYATYSSCQSFAALRHTLDSKGNSPLRSSANVTARGYLCTEIDRSPKFPSTCFAFRFCPHARTSLLSVFLLRVSEVIIPLICQKKA